MPLSMSKITKAFVPYSPFSQRCRSPLALSTKPRKLPSWRPCRACVMQMEDPYEERSLNMGSFSTSQSSQVFEGDNIVNMGNGEFDFDENDEGLDIVDIPPESRPIRRKRVRKNMGLLLDEISTEPISDLASDADELPPVEQDESAKFVRTVVRAIDQRKGENIVAFRVSKLTYITSFVVIASAKNTPQMKAIANLVEEDMSKKHDRSFRRKDGIPESGWILLDYGDFMVNIFSAAQRRNYNLEKLWQKAEEFDVSDEIVAKPDDAAVEASSAGLDDWLSE